jgi:DNA-binding MarR family transcriptional regulator
MVKAKSDPGALEGSPSHLLHRVLQRALDLYAESAGPGAVTQRQFAVLAAVQADEGATQAGLVKVTGIDRSTLADLVARMIAKGLLERERSVLDARANAVRLTDAGRAALEDAAPKTRAADEALLKLLPGSKRAAFLAALSAMAAGERGKDPAKPKRSKSAKKVAKAQKKARKKARRTKAPESAPVAA